MTKKLTILICVLIFAGACVTGFLYLNFRSWANRPMKAKGRDKIFTVSPGQGLKQTARALEQQGLVSDALRFTLLARLEKKAKLIKAGEYFFSTTMTPKQILDQMVEGRVHLYRLTIPEGYNLVQIAAAVAAAGLGSQKQFLAAARDPKTARHFDIDADTVEGYLFPDTYYFPHGLHSLAIITTMIKQFRAAFKPAWRKRAKALGMSVNQVVTLASMIEKETGDPPERALISSVFHNRLKIGMRLESDPTVIYGIPNFDGNLTRRNLETYTPYNTYMIKGLPPGPIASPGAASLKAALYPADTHFLYFVSKQDGTHKFSTTLKEHLAAVRKYQLGKK